MDSNLFASKPGVMQMELGNKENAFLFDDVMTFESHAHTIDITIDIAGMANKVKTHRQPAAKAGGTQYCMTVLH
jgi:hypothetical protein